MWRIGHLICVLVLELTYVSNALWYMPPVIIARYTLWMKNPSSMQLTEFVYLHRAVKIGQNTVKINSITDIATHSQPTYFVWNKYHIENCKMVARTWWPHQMKIISALLAICVGNSPVPGEFPAQRPVMRSFDVFFDLRLNKWLSKQWWGWWSETLSPPLWRHCNDVS